MFQLNFEDRLASWHEFRQSLETSQNPIQDTVDFYKSAPKVSINCDPWDPETWPNPWELLEENVYCECCILLGICYTLRLTEKFAASKFELLIVVDDATDYGYEYLLVVDDTAINGSLDSVVPKNSIPKTVQSKTIYDLSLVL